MADITAGAPAAPAPGTDCSVLALTLTMTLPPSATVMNDLFPIEPIP